MILTYGDGAKLEGLDWYMLELRSEKTVEATMKRLGLALSGIFRESPVEIFIPVFKRDLDLFEMKTGCYVFARSADFKALLRLKQVTGVVCLATKGDSNRPSDAIPADDTYVQSLIRMAEKEFVDRAIGIEVGSFVRILNGETRDYCGTVELIHDGWAAIRVDLKTKSLLIETPIRNLLNLSDVPVGMRVFYYGPLVEDLIREKDGDGAALIEEDLHLREDDPPIDIPELPQTEEPKRHSRSRTVTALVKKLVLIDNKHDPLEIAEKVVDALKSGDIKAPKNLFIVYCIIKDNLMKSYFKKIDPALDNYREVIHKYGKAYKFSAEDIKKIDPNLGIPVATVEVCKDGRSREARLRSKAAKEAQKVNQPTTAKKREMAATTKEKLLAGLKRYHAERRQQREQGVPVVEKPKRTMSPEAKSKLSESLKRFFAEKKKGQAAS